MEPSYGYDVGGLLVHVSFPIAGLHRRERGVADAVDVAVTWQEGNAPGPRERVFQWPGFYGLCLWRACRHWQFTTAGYGSFAVSDDGSSVCCFPARGERSPPPGLQEVLSRRLLPRVALLHGRIALHAASVGDGRVAMLLFGPTRAGKSTLSAALSQRFDLEVLSDDISLIDGDACCFPVAAGTRLRADALGVLGTGSEPVACRDDKRLSGTPSGAAATRSPVRSIVFLSSGSERHPGEIAISRIPATQALLMAADLAVLFNPASRREAMAGLLPMLAPLVEAAPAYLASYPRDFELLPILADRLGARLHAQVA